jgi:hypothetical protein
MAYLAISDFQYGMDRRRPRSVGIPGTLWMLQNALISRGGDIVRAKKFDDVHSLPSGTFGLSSVKEQLFVFGSGSTPSGMPVSVQYQQLAAPSSPAMTGIVDAKPFDGKFYVIAEYEDGTVYHFYDGARVTDWDGLADAAFDYESVADALASRINAIGTVDARSYGDVIVLTAKTAGTAFTLATGTTDGSGTPGSLPTAATATSQANVAAVAEVQATGTVTITGGSASAGVNTVSSVTVDGTELLDTAVDFISSNESTANALAVEITNNTATHGYTASAAGAIVTITAEPGTGSTPNGDVVAVTTTGDVTASKTNMASGVDAVAAVAQVSTVTISATTSDATDRWEVTVNGTLYQITGRASAMGTSILAYKSRIYSTAGSLLRYCAINDPTDWTTAGVSGAGNINMAQQSAGAQKLVGAAVYNNYVAIFARSATIIYSLETDTSNNSFVQELENTGTMAAGSIVSYGANDVFYLDDTGIRSLRSRQGYNAAYSNDAGNAIDPYAQDLMDELSSSELANATSVIEGRDSRYFLALGQKILALSFFPSSDISAWSVLDLEFDIDVLHRSGREIYVRSDDTIYQYGGADGETYPAADEFEVSVITAFMGAQDPATKKNLRGFDFAAENTWRVQTLLDPDDDTAKVEYGRLTGTTYRDLNAMGVGQAGVFALEFTCDLAGYASLSAVAQHYDSGEQG